MQRPHIGAASTKSGRTEERHQPGGEGSLYQGISSGKLSATARKPMANAVASAQKMTTTSPSRDIAFPLGPIHFVRCACLFASENSELSQRKSPSERGCSGPCTRRTTAALRRRFLWNASWRGAGFSTRCHSALLMPHPGGAFLRFGMQVGSHNSRSTRTGCECQSTIALCSDSPWQSGSDSRDLLRAGLRHGGRSGGGSGGERFNTTAHMRVQWDRRA